jgi:hypothetical protein
VSSRRQLCVCERRGTLHAPFDYFENKQKMKKGSSCQPGRSALLVMHPRVRPTVEQHAHIGNDSMSKSTRKRHTGMIGIYEGPTTPRGAWLRQKSCQEISCSRSGGIQEVSFV